VSTCRPAGTARFGDKIVDVVSEGEFIEPGRTVVIQNISGNRVIVKEQEKKR
jgi:membrane-bound serine protease (ClpP class)